ncbi:unnamed protein product [Microthlaspi erraticum]|uniref:BRISC and BRCA1-A complex member 2 n=1 Tax=Microthlaspi erraticum TaxID=1685480 RepID=A0A6D2JKX4_9BRAS|nr:unnamed protein product [Microthlaspi erraticum]
MTSGVDKVFIVSRFFDHFSVKSPCCMHSPGSKPWREVRPPWARVPAAPRLKLVSSSDLKALFSVEDDVKLPPWMDGMCLAEYLPHLEETLERQVSFN